MKHDIDANLISWSRLAAEGRIGKFGEAQQAGRQAVLLCSSPHPHPHQSSFSAFARFAFSFSFAFAFARCFFFFLV